MNERIKELLKQAEERYPRHLAVAVPEVVLRQDALKKFAELIIKECIEAFKKDECVLNHFGIEHHQNK